MTVHPDAPAVIVVGSAARVPEIETALGDAYRVVHENERSGYVARLIESLAALVIVVPDAEAEADDWRFWVATPKSSPATRRIPVVLAADSGEVREKALLAGADLTLTRAELDSRLPRIARDYARVPDPARMQQLDCECDEPLPELAQQGIEKFNAGEYYKQHDLFEALWVETDGPVRDLYRAILQVGVAYFQIQRGNYNGALKMLQRSVQWLAILPDQCQGVDVAALRQDSYRVRAELERLGPDGLEDFDMRLIQPVKRVS